MPTDSSEPPIDPYKDNRVSHQQVQLNGRSYHYVLGIPDGEPRGTVFLVHGFQDLWYGWRHQIPALLILGLRVVAIDCLGYGGTEAPRVPPETMDLYGFKRCADDIAELAKQMHLSNIILGGHDWGGMIVSRVYLYHPNLVKGIFSLGTPYLPPDREWLDFDAMIVEKPTFEYQRNFGSQDFEDHLQSKDAIHDFFNATFGGRGPNGELGFSTKGVLVENWKILEEGTQLSKKEIEYYVDQYARNGLHGPLNWYRNRRQNYEDEESLSPTSTIQVPYLFVQSLKDPFLPPSMSEGMERYIPNLRRREVDSGHFCHVLCPLVVNQHIVEWLKEVVISSDG
ncbi:bifunctional epoxide hydrolase 2 [Physcia stellaris]|nr:bifunctional epoxide hydrolase 2 [Physcia stellaris]